MNMYKGKSADILNFHIFYLYELAEATKGQSLSAIDSVFTLS